ncbi:MAG: cupin domain-containing protein [Alphaproteobacteria bacterium]
MAELTTATANVQEDNERVRVTEYRFPPGSETTWHIHEFDYVVVPMTNGTLTIHNKDGISEYPLTAGQAYYRQAGVEHNVTNVGTAEIVFVETEIKAHPLNK